MQNKHKQKKENQNQQRKNLQVLHQEEWTKEAAQLLELLKGIALKNKSCMLFLRHSKREEVTTFESIPKLRLTAEGEQGAFEFGNSLPSAFQYRIFSSPVGRCQTTALKLQEGLKACNNNVIVEYQGVLPILYRISGDGVFMKESLRHETATEISAIPFLILIE